MKNVLLSLMCVSLLAGVMGCTTTKGKSDELKNNLQASKWYDGAMLLIDANDPDMKADAHTGILAIDGPLDTVKDIIALVPEWTVSKVEETYFNNMYDQSNQALSASTEDAKLTVKGEAFKAALLMDTFVSEVAHSKAALALEDAESRMKNYADNEKIYKAALDKVNDYANNHVLAYESLSGNDDIKAFFMEPSRKQWDAKCEEISGKIMECIDRSASDSEENAKAGKEKLCKAMGVQSVDWTSVGLRLSNDLAKLQKASMDITTALANPELASQIVASRFGKEIVPGTSAKETLAAIERAKKQLTVSIRLISHLIEQTVVK